MAQLNKPSATFFAPHLAIKVLRPAVEFYQTAFDAKTIRQFDNDDGSIHVAEMEIDGCIFHLHEEVVKSKQLSPETLHATTLLIGVFCDDPDRFMVQAEKAGGRVTSPMQDFDYGYRQGVITDPYGHQWLLQKRI
ncbi:MAG: VOC family protein [Chryseolinea sp.]